MAVVEVTLSNFNEEVLNSDKLVLVDFYATWCGPCMMMAPFVEEVAEEKADIKVCKLNVDDDPELAEEFEIFSIPTLLVFKDGNLVKKNVGALTKEMIIDFIGDVL